MSQSLIKSWKASLLFGKDRIGSLLALGLFGALAGCATGGLNYEESTSAYYAGNNQFEISSIGFSSQQTEEIKNHFYRKAYEVCASKGKGFKVVQKNSVANSTIIVNSGFCSMGRCWPEAYRKDLPNDTGLIECDGAIDPEFVKAYGPLGQDGKSSVPTVVASPRPYEGNNVEKTNAVSLEILGRASLYSINYDRLITSDLALGFGFSYWTNSFHWGSLIATSRVVPVYLNYYFSPFQRRLFVTGGADFIFTYPSYNSASIFQTTGTAAVFGGGFEYRGNSGFLFRAAPYILIGNVTSFSFGIGVGGVF